MKTTTKKPSLKAVKLTEIAIISNTRTFFDEEKIKELSESIFKNGLLQPVGLHLVNGHYHLIYGERRFRASILLQKTVIERDSIDAKIYEGLTDQEIVELQIVENLHREDIHPIEEANAYKKLIDCNKQSVAEIALSVAKSVSYVTQRLKLNDLYEEFKTAFFNNRMNLTLALKICKISVEDQEALWVENFADVDDSDTIEMEEHDFKKYLNNLNNAPFNILDASIHPKMGACSVCPFNSAVNTLLFPDEAQTATCTNSTCFQDKTNIAFEADLKEALESPAVELVSCAYDNSSNLVKELIDKGHKVYDRNSFFELTPPEKVELSDFQDDLENENYESEEEMISAYNKAVQEYEAEHKEFLEKTISETSIIAFVVAGNKKGKHIFIEFGKGGEAKQTSKGLTEKMKSNTVTSDDVKTEINRINQNEARKKELEEEKVQPLIYEAFAKDKAFKSNANALNIPEKVGLLIMLLQYGGYSLENEFNKIAKIKGSNSKVGLFDSLSIMKEKDLDKLFNVFVRSLMLSKMKPTNASRPSNNVLVASFNDIVKSYNATALDDAWKPQLQERAKRAERVKEKINLLKSKLKELSNKAKSIAA